MDTKEVHHTRLSSRKPARVLAVLVIAAISSACSTVSQREIETEQEIASYYRTSSDELIAHDLLSAMSKLDGFEPQTTTVQTKAPKTTFDFAILSALEELGYATRIVKNIEEGNLLTHSTQALPDEQYRVHRKYTLAFRNIVLERSYLFDLQDVKTGSKLMVAGALPIEHTPQNTLLVSGQKPQVEVNTIAAASENSFGSLKQKRNVFDIGGSNYRKILGKRDEIKKSILIFANDSLRIGEQNKTEIQAFVKAFNPELDVFSIIGCSHGKSNITNGNALLATGRAQRVKEALLFSGVPENKILDEGCWDSKLKAPNMPFRGVVLTLNRRT